jgi:hypothetical protein
LPNAGIDFWLIIQQNIIEKSMSHACGASESKIQFPTLAASGSE